MTTTKALKMTAVIQTYSSAECNEFDVLCDNVRIGYYIEHFNHPETGERLDSTIYEVYYDYDSEFDECLASMIFDDFDDFAEFMYDEFDIEVKQ